MFNFFKKQKPAGEELTLKITGMHCSSCSMNIDGELEELPGVYEAHTSYQRSETKVKYDPAQVDKATLQKTIENLGYSVHW
jgi:copper chaperone CopZ